MLYRTYCEIELNRPLKEHEHVSVGGFHLVTRKATEVDFDFCDSYCYKNDNVLSFELRNPDMTVFENIKDYTIDDFTEIDHIEDFYIDIEDCDDDLQIVGYKSFMIEFDTGDDIREVIFDKSLLDTYNKVTFE